MKYLTPLVFVIIGYVVGLIYLSTPELNYIENNVLNNHKMEFVNDYTKMNAPFNFQESDKNVLVYMNATCYTRAQNLEKWYDFSKNIDANVYVILIGEISYYLNYLLNNERMFDDRIFILNDKYNTFHTFNINNKRVNEAIILVDNNGIITNAYNGLDIPNSLY